MTDRQKKGFLFNVIFIVRARATDASSDPAPALVV